MNPATEELLDQLRTKTSPPKRTDWSAEDEAETKLYRGDDGAIGIPSLNLFSSLVEAGRLVKAGTKQISTAKSTILPSFLSIEEFFLPFKNDPEWVVDKRRGRNPNGGEMVCLVRPKFADWEFDATLEIDESEVNEDGVRKLVETAGKKVGLCDFRPACKGPFGRFYVASWVKQDNSTNGKAAVGAEELATAVA
jgi:hypothetical protein